MSEAVPESRPPLPPFDRSDAVQKVRMAENAWNGRDPAKVAAAYTVDCEWRNRIEFIRGREQIVAFLTRKWATEHEYRLIKELWAYHNRRIAVRFVYEWHDVPDGNGAVRWFRSHGNENWEFNDNGLMVARHASINDVPIAETDRKFRWPQGPRPSDHPGLCDLGL